MEIYLPPIFTLLLGIVTIGIIYLLRIPIPVIAVLSLILVAYTLYIHVNLFTIDYRTSYLGDALKSSASTIMVSAVIIACIIYVLITRSRKSGSVSSSCSSKSSWFGSSSTSTMTQPSRSWFSNSGSSSRDPYRDKRQDYISALDRAI